MMTRSRYLACLFDLYDTLLYLDRGRHWERSAKLAELCGTEVEEFLQVWKSLVERSNRGEFPKTEDRAAEVLLLLGRDPTTDLVREIALVEHQFLRSSSLLYDDTAETLERLRQKKVRLALVTNASPSVWEVLRSTSLEESFDQIVVSSECGIRKPDAGIYLEALHRLNVEPAQAAFVGDGNDRELDGAKAVGCITIHIERQGFQPIRSQQSNTAAIDFTINSLTEIPQLLGLD